MDRAMEKVKIRVKINFEDMDRVKRKDKYNNKVKSSRPSPWSSSK